MTTSQPDETSHVKDLSAGDVISLPDAGHSEPALIDGISDPVGGVRFINLVDLQTGNPIDTRLVLGLDRAVKKHAIEVAVHRYTNESGQTLHPDAGDGPFPVASGATVEYVGVARPDVYPPPDWSHDQDEIETGSESRPL